MVARIKVLAVLTGLALAVPALAEGEWKPLTSKEGRFSVQVPGTPKEQSLEVPSAAGKIKVKLFVVDLGGTAYVVSFNDYPADLVKQSQTDKMLDGARDGSIANVKGKLLKEKKITLGTHPGRDYEYEALEGKALARARVYLVENRLYQMVFMSSDKKLPKEVDKFMDSFKLEK